MDYRRIKTRMSSLTRIAQGVEMSKEPYQNDEPDYSERLSLRLDKNLPDMDRLTLRQQGEARAVGKKIGDEYAARVGSIRKNLLSLPAEDPRREGLTAEAIERRARSGEPNLNCRAEDFTWVDLQSLIEKEGEDASAIVWQTLKRVARANLAAGNPGCTSLLADRTPFEMAEYSVIVESFIDSWEPQHAIEQSMVEMLAQAFISYTHWLKVANHAAEFSYNAIEETVKVGMGWKPPTITAAETVENAMQMADRFNRLFLRTLRQMRDLRRYPVTINNAAQVNIGNQQVNVKE